MSPKLVVQQLYKVFGKHADKGLALAKQGMSRKDILLKTDCAMALRNISLDIYEHEILVIMGLSGSGKSTLLRCFNRLIDPTEGTILLEGTDITKLSEKELLELRRNHFAMVFQNFALFPHRNILQNVEYGLELMGIPAITRTEKAMEALETVGLNDWTSYFPDQLSGGMQQRVGLARALAMDTDIILMDEAFSALDPITRREMQDELLSLQNRLNKTIIFITHDLDEALKLGSRIVMLCDGDIVQIDTPEDLLKHPANDYVRSFVSSADLSSVLTAKTIMKKSETFAILGHDGPHSALRKMRTHSITSLFVLDKKLQFYGIINADDVKMLAHTDIKKLDSIVKTDIAHVSPETSAAEIMKIMAELPYPLAVVDSQKKLQGVIVRGGLLGALAEHKESNYDYS